MSEYLDRKLLLWADMRVAILARPRLFPKPPPGQAAIAARHAPWQTSD
jgi:hypothetical protein